MKNNFIRIYVLYLCTVDICLLNRKSILEFGLDNIKFDTSLMADQRSKEYMTEASQVFLSSLKKLCVPNCISYTNSVAISIRTSSPFDNIKLTTNESYNLKITTEGIY